MKVLIADKFEKVGIDGLKELGCTVISEPEVKAEALPDLIRQVDPNILIVRSKKVNADALRAGTALTLVVRAGAGIDLWPPTSGPAGLRAHLVRALAAPVRTGPPPDLPSWDDASSALARLYADVGAPVTNGRPGAR